MKKGIAVSVYKLNYCDVLIFEENILFIIGFLDAFYRLTNVARMLFYFKVSDKGKKIIETGLRNFVMKIMIEGSKSVPKVMNLNCNHLTLKAPVTTGRRHFQSMFFRIFQRK